VDFEPIIYSSLIATEVKVFMAAEIDFGGRIGG